MLPVADPQQILPPRNAVACLKFNSRALNPAQNYYEEHYKEVNPNKVRYNRYEQERRQQPPVPENHHVNSVEFQRVQALQSPTKPRNENHRKQYLYGIQQTSHVPQQYQNHHIHRHHHHPNKNQARGQRASPIIIR